MRQAGIKPDIGEKLSREQYLFGVLSLAIKMDNKDIVGKNGYCQKGHNWDAGKFEVTGKRQFSYYLKHENKEFSGWYGKSIVKFWLQRS